MTAGRERAEGVYGGIAYYGTGRDRRTQHQALKRLAAAQGHIGLAVGERRAHVYDGMAERQALALVYGDGPRRLHWVLAEHALHHLLYLLRLLVKLIAAVGPLLGCHLYGIAALLGHHAEATAADGRHASYHAVVVAFVGR